MAIFTLACDRRAQYCLMARLGDEPCGGASGPAQPSPIAVVAQGRRASVDLRDAQSIERARRILGDRYRGGLVVYRGTPSRG
jgi:hypothetical protein